MCIVHGKTVDDAVQYTGRRHAGQQHDQVWLQSGEEWFWPGLESANVASLNNNYAVSDQLILLSSSGPGPGPGPITYSELKQAEKLKH